MTGPASGAHDPRIINHPEYRRSYDHYLQQGAPPDEAARQAYEWTRQHLAKAPGAAIKTNHVVLGVAAAVVLSFCGLGAIGVLTGGGDQDTASVETPIASSVSTSPSPSPTPSPTTEAPTVPPTVPPAAPTLAPAPTTAAPAPPPPTRRAPQVAPTTRRPAAPAPAPAAACNPAYPDECLRDGIGDYDCEGGSGNGPNYVSGPIRVLPPDPFDLDRDSDGLGCES
jgi:hypothetical protein